jgi:hypothetical protein
MLDESIKSARAAMEAEKARRLKEAAAELDRSMAEDMALLEQLAAKYNLRVVPADPDIKPANVVFVGPRKVEDPTDSMTLRELAEKYRSDERSPYRALRFKVRDSYDNLIDRLIADLGDLKLSDISADVIQQHYDNWTAGGVKLSMGHAMATRLRGLFSFGTTTLNDAGCIRLSIIMSKMRFTTPAARSEYLTLEMVNAIRAKAHELGKPSIALAQAFQYFVELSQKDVVGEWLPASEPGESDIAFDGLKWVAGLRWSEIDEDFVLRHVTSFRQELVTIDLKRFPAVMEEFNKLPSDTQRVGAVIRSEWNNRPWSTNEYRRWWRKIADVAGVPKNIKNMDSRPLEARSLTTRNSLDARRPEQQRLIP